MKLQHKAPCNECPWRTTAPAGWLGGHTAEMYADAVAGNEVPACHQQDHGPRSSKTAMCAGALAVIANACIMPHKTKGCDAAAKEVGRRQDCFVHPAQFFTYHTGRPYVPFLLRIMK